MKYCWVVQELAEKNNYTMAEVGKVKIELNQTISKLEGERSVHADLREKLAQADKELSGEWVRGHIHACIHTHTHTHTHTHAHACTDACTLGHMYARPQSHTHTLQMHTQTHDACIHTHTTPYHCRFLIELAK